MEFKPKIDETINRYKQLWAREYKNKILVKINLENSSVYPSLIALSKSPNYADMLLEWEKGFEIAKNIDDDNLPVVYGDLGSYIIGGFFGARVTYGTGGAYSEKLIIDMKNFKNYLNFSKENKYYNLALDFIKFLAQKSDNRFGFTEMCTIDGLNLLDCLRGVDAYTDLFDYPEEIIKLMDFGSDFNIDFIKTQRRLIKPFKEGRFNFYQTWTPKETIFISVDAYGNCNSSIFEKFGRKYVQRLIDEFGSGWLHVHSDAYRLLPNYIKLKNLIAIGLEDSIKPPRMIEHINEVKEVVGDIPLMININKEELLHGINSKTLPGNILYWINDVKNIKEANQIAEMSKGYCSPYKKKIKFVKNTN
ncbi:MAG: hypothetical protein M1326_03395 [Cyanobacteria bacterium]|nr:hypothetical protein [Cyanobacteriota bacterium]